MNKILIVLLFLLSSSFVWAEKSKNSTDVSFEDLLVKGKYHFSDEAVTTVEADKVLDSLLGIRKDFNDRIKRSATTR